MLKSFNLYGYDEKSHENAIFSIGNFDDTIQEIKKSNKVKLNLFLNHRNSRNLMKLVNLAIRLKTKKVEFFYFSTDNKSFKNIYDGPIASHILDDINAASEKLANNGIETVYNKNNGLKKLFDSCDIYLKNNLLINRDKKSNNDVNTKEIQQMKCYLTSYPTMLYLELTRNCNCNCIMCARAKHPQFQKYDSKFDMPFSLYKLIVDTLFPYAMHVDMRGFGETLLHPELDKMLDYSKKYDVQYQIITNLSIGDRKKIELLIKHRFHTIISFDAHEKSLYEKIRRGSNFNLIIDNIKYLIKRMKEEQIPVKELGANITVQKSNLNYVFDIVKLLNNIGVKKAILNLDRTLEPNNTELSMLSKQVNSCLNYGKKRDMFIFQRITKVNSYQKEESPSKEKLFCPRPWRQAYITYNGLVGPCDHLMEPPLYFGDLAKDSFENIWNNKSFNLFRKWHLDRKIEICTKCYKNPDYIEKRVVE